jgi:uncharacterized coiled-coil protein SlyX
VGEKGHGDPVGETVHEVGTTLQRCSYCGREFQPNRGVGRPGKYCRRSCRQRAFEQRRHIGDQAWSDARLIRMSEQLAEHEDIVDQVREVVAELRADVADDQQVDGQVLLERLEAALVVVPPE